MFNLKFQKERTNIIYHNKIYIKYLFFDVLLMNSQVFNFLDLIYLLYKIYIDCKYYY